MQAGPSSFLGRLGAAPRPATLARRYLADLRRAAAAGGEGAGVAVDGVLQSGQHMGPSGASAEGALCIFTLPASSKSTASSRAPQERGKQSTSTRANL